MPQRSSTEDATDILTAIRTGQRSAEQVMQEHLDRIRAHGDRLNATVEVFAEAALEQARAPLSGPLSGLPISLKETFALAGHEITAGSLRMPPVKCPRDAPVVRRLKEAGAIVVARSTVPEFVMTGETRSLRWGVTNNPIDPTRVPGGSTGGEGALVGSGCTPVGMGTDILGSIRVPSCFCGIVGFRPASGLVDKTDVWTSGVGFFETWNGIGPMARSVRDVRLVYDVIAEKPLAEPEAVADLRLITPTHFPFKARDSLITDAAQLATSCLTQAGMVPEKQSFSDVSRLFKNMPHVVAAESIPAWRRWLTTGEGKRFNTVSETFRQILRRPSIEPGFFTWFLMELPMRPSTKKYRELVAMYEAARRHYHELLGDDGILILPTLGVFAPEHKAMNRLSLRPGINELFTAHTFANYMNLSAITVPAPACRDEATGLVPGVMLSCAPGAEARLLDAAAVMEAGLR